MLQGRRTRCMQRNWKKKKMRVCQPSVSFVCIFTLHLIAVVPNSSGSYTLGTRRRKYAIFLCVRECVFWEISPYEYKTKCHFLTYLLRVKLNTLEFTSTRMSVREFEGHLNVNWLHVCRTHFLCDVIHMPTSFWLVKGPGFSFFTCNGLQVPYWLEQVFKSCKLLK